jgi:hypothetical protein
MQHRTCRKCGRAQSTLPHQPRRAAQVSPGRKAPEKSDVQRRTSTSRESRRRPDAVRARLSRRGTCFNRRVVYASTRRLSAPKARHRLARSVRAGTPDPARTLSAGSATRRVQNPPKTRTANSFFVQAAAIACGFASKVMEQSGLTAVVGRLEYVTYNGSRLSRTDAEEQERRLCARAGT